MRKTKRVELWKTDHGVDGWDAKTILVALFSSREKALKYLSARGYDFIEYPTLPDHFAHRDEKYRYTMGKLTYEIKQAVVELDPSHDFIEPR